MDARSDVRDCDPSRAREAKIAGIDAVASSELALAASTGVKRAREAFVVFYFYYYFFFFFFFFFFVVVLT